MSETLIKAATEVGPVEGEIHVQSAPITSQVIDLNATPVAAFVSNGDFITLYCDQLLYYRFSTNPAAVADEAAVAGVTQVAAMPALTPTRCKIPDGFRYLVTKAAVLGTVRIWGSSATLA